MIFFLIAATAAAAALLMSRFVVVFLRRSVAVRMLRKLVGLRRSHHVVPAAEDVLE